MSSDLGFIKLERGIVDHWVFTKDPEYRIWIYLIFLAKFSNSEKPVKIGKEERVLDRGEFITSIGKIADKLHLKPRVVRRVLDLFKKNNMIKKTAGRGKNIPYVAKVVNYNKWQGEYTIKTQSKGFQEAFKSQHTNKGNNVNKEIANWLYKCEVCDTDLIVSEFGDLQISCQQCGTTGVRHKIYDK